MFWDKVAGVYDLFVNVVNRKCHKDLCAYVEGLFNSCDQVLECGCGTGMLTKHIAGNCKTITATDFSEKMLIRARKNCTKFTNVTCEWADITDLKYDDNSFDKAVAANVIHLLEDPKATLKGLERVCRNGGELIIPTYVNREKKGKDNIFSKMFAKAGAGFKRQFSFDSYKEFIRDCGYSDADFKLIGGKMPCAVAVIRVKKSVE